MRVAGGGSVRVVGGNQAKAENVPWNALLEWKGGKNTGTAIIQPDS